MSQLRTLVEIIDQLRSPGGCPWDRAQTWSSMRPYLLEEVYEVLDAVDQHAQRRGSAAAVGEELGDLLFVVLLMARMGEDLDAAGVSVAAVAAGISAKMVRRHPHVFGEAPPITEAMGVAAWEDQKAQPSEPGGRPRSRLAGVPRSLPALLRAHRQSEKAATVGFDWPDASGVFAKVDEELGELREALSAADADAVEREYGDVLMALASLGRHIGATPEEALQRANSRFQTRFERMEELAYASGRALSDLDDAQLDALWNDARAQLRAAERAAPSPPPDGV